MNEKALIKPAKERLPDLRKGQIFVRRGKNLVIESVDGHGNVLYKDYLGRPKRATPEVFADMVENGGWMPLS